MDVREVNRHESFVVELDDKPGSGYLWVLETPEKFDIISRAVGKDYNPEAVGSPIKVWWTVRAKAVGEHELRFALKRSWNNDVIRRYKEIVRVS